MKEHRDQLQVRQGDQPWYPIQDRSFVAHGGSRMPCAPACKLGTVTKNWTCDKSPSEQGLPPHTKAVCRENISPVAFSNWSWKNCSRELQNDSMAKVWETNQEGITKMSPHRGKKCNEKNAMTKMHVHEENGQQQYVLALVEGLIDVRLGKNLSVHIRHPAASSYWKLNWWIRVFSN